jgi:3-deoxy-D-manno-octulosonate 8-phosphate phosphatase (KDO 8-P phosphatase)
MGDIIYRERLVIKRKFMPVPENFVLDLDGVFTDGKFYYNQDGKYMKVFGADDHECLNVLKKFMNIHVVTADSKGFNIAKKRIQEDMDIDIELVSAPERVPWLAEKYDLLKTIYMGDGVLDYLVFEKVFYSIAPANALSTTKKRASFVTKNSGGNRAVAEACMHILKRFFPAQNHNLF